MSKERITGWVNTWTGEFKSENPGWNNARYVVEDGGWITDRTPTEDEVGDDDYTMGCLDGRVFVINGRNLRSAGYGKYAWMMRPDPYRDESLKSSIERVREQHIKSKNFALTDLYHEDIGRILEAAGKVADYENQLLLLRQWCREQTGVETNDLIGKKDWPKTLVGCVAKAFSDAGLTKEF